MVRGTNFMKNIIYIVLCMFASAGLAQVYPGNPYHFNGDFTGSGMISNSGTAGTATNAPNGFPLNQIANAVTNNQLNVEFGSTSAGVIIRPSSMAYYFGSNSDVSDGFEIDDSNAAPFLVANPIAKTLTIYGGGFFRGSGLGLENIPLTSLENLPVTNFQSNVTLAGTFTGNGGGLTNLNASYPRYITNFSSLLFTNIGAVSNAVLTWFPATNTFLSVAGAVGCTYNYGATCRIWITYADIKGTTNAFPLIGQPANNTSMPANITTNFSIVMLPFWVSTNTPVTIAFVNGAGTNNVWYDFSLEQKHP